MAEYIEREALIEHIKDLLTWDYIAKADGFYEKSTKYPEGNFNCDDVINSINNAPAADVVEVVRCKDCQHSINCVDNDGVVMCVLNSEYNEDTGLDYGFVSYHSENHFCGYGERRCDNG